jgi:hypothetical protein
VVLDNPLGTMPRQRNHYIRGRKITAPTWGGLDLSASAVVSARIFREALDNGTAEITDLDAWLQFTPEHSRPAFLEALEALGINH